MYGKKLRELRTEKNLLLKDIATILKVDRSICGRYETEYDIIPLINLNIICNYYDVSLDYIFDFTLEKNYQFSTKEIDNKLAGERLKEFRKDNKLTQAKLAETLNTVQPVIANYEKGKHLIATSFLYDLCKKYNISADYLLGKIDDPKYLK